MIDSNTQPATADAGAIRLRSLPVQGASQIDGLRLVETQAGPVLLYSTQVCRTPRRGLYDCEMRISAVAADQPERVTPVATLPRLLPSPPSWDARAVQGGYEVLFEEAGGAIYSLQLRDASSQITSPSSARFLQSFTRPRFVRGMAAAQSRATIAIVDDQKLAVLPEVGAQPIVLVDAAEGVVGRAQHDFWAVTKTFVGGPAMYDESPGRLAVSRWAGFDAAAGASSTAFPGFLGFEFDAAWLGNDVIVFATGKPAALLRSSQPARAIALVAEDRQWLSRLSRPTISVANGRVHVAAIVDPATEGARIVYGDFAVDVALRP